MSFPSVADRGSARTVATDTTSHAITMPSHVTGDLLLVHFACDGSATHSAIGTGWSTATNVNGAIVRGSIFWKIAASSAESLTVTSSAAEQSSHTVLVIRPSSGYTLGIESASANGSSTNSNPPALTPSAGTKDYLWIATRAGDSTVVATVAPTSFSNLQTLAGVGTASASSNTAERQLNASTLDPGTFTSATEQWVSHTVAVWEVALPPAITTQPTDQTASVGATATFVGAASGAGVTYQWQRLG